MDADRPADEIVRFWETARSRAGLGRLSVVTGTSAATAVPPPAWAFGADPQQADELLALVLEGTKTATASARWEYEAEGEELPRPGELSIVLDGAGHPRALVRTTSVDVVPFRDVTAEHAHAEGEGDRSLAHWRAVHERFFSATLAEVGRGFDDGLLVVCERLQLLHPKRRPVRERAPEPVDA
ncbi:ASCH domain-containing protein [Pseudokineococcus marinus]|uniref:ASCH domain-containing protein n=1 Tax=Pseudokineococcus marinus TaxID=351215 RepID=A0A849BTP8_9ACTN|nr:ASCH domain-containing protein [Pseudokineococcus marinus]NNH22896.1 ASCH domain-containing protein [Pseudokineococcus marinus]